MRPSQEYAGKTKTLTDDERAVASQELREELTAMAFLAERIKAKAEVNLELAYNVLSLKESRLTQLCALLDIELDSASAREARYADLRAANMKVRELEQQLGLTGSAHQTQAHLTVLGEKLNLWWDQHGFGHIGKMSFSQYGSLEVQFSCMLFGAGPRLLSRSPVSDKVTYEDWLKSLRDRGFELTELPGERDLSLVDSDANRALLMALVARHFPSAQVVSTTNHYSREGVCTLQDLNVFIRDLADLDKLPLPVKEAKK